MTLDALNPAAAPVKRKRSKSKRVFDDDYFAGCLIALAGSGGGATFVDAKKQTRSSSYNCTICGKAFSSRRALSRHRSEPPPAAADDMKPSNSTSAASCCRLFKCSICGKTFPKGQALGGHMRKHFGGNGDGRKSGANSSDGGNCPTDATSFDGVVSNYSDGDVAPIARN